MIEITADEYQELRDEYSGICLNCEEYAEGVEPDARDYECEACGEKTVYGIEEALMMGKVTITD